MRRLSRVFLPLLLVVGCVWGPHRHVEMRPKRAPFLSEGSKWPQTARYPEFAIDGHLARFDIYTRPRSFEGGPPPYALSLELFALSTAYDSVRLDSLRIISSLGHTHVVYLSESSARTQALLPDSTPLPAWWYQRQWWGAKAPARSRRRAGFYTDTILRPDMTRHERLTVHAYLTLLAPTRHTSGKVRAEFRPYIRKHYFYMISV